MPGTHDTIVLVHGAGEGDVQGGALVEFAEPLVQWLADNGAEELVSEPISIRRGMRPARLHLSGRLPDPDRPGAARDFAWQIVEARWADEHVTRSELGATAWALRALPDALIDHLGYYDSVWRFWRAITGAVSMVRPLVHAPAMGADAQAWRYRYDAAWPFLLRLLYVLWIGLVLPIVVLSIATIVLLPMTLLWLFNSALDSWERAYWNGLYRLVLVVLWVPVLVIAAVALAALLVVAALPVALPWIGTWRRGVLRMLHLSWLEHAMFDVERVNGASLEEAVGATIASELNDARSLTIVGHGLGAVLAYETLGALARPTRQPDVQNPYVTVSQAISAIDRPLPRYGLPITLVTVGSALNRSRAWRRRPLLLDALPEGTRWVDVWSMHDPVAMGSTDRRIVETSGATVLEVRATNHATLRNAPSAYWPNATQVATTVAEEVIAASASRVLPAPEGASPQPWMPRSAGTWEWRLDHAHADRDCTTARRNRVVRTLALLRLGVISGLACCVGQAYMAPGEVIFIEHVAAAALPAVVSLGAYGLGMAVLEALGAGIARWWMARPCAHTRFAPNAVRL